ncbi:MAG: hypothetical protein EBS19_13790 [Spirochaetia bacterium]|nr:hypothetical protein [Spirochaetia bacterium]
MNKMKNMPGMGNIQSMLNKMGFGGKMNTGAMESQMNKNMKQALFKEKMRAKMEAKRQSQAQAQAKQESGTNFEASAPTHNGLSDEELTKIYEDQVNRCKRDSEKLTEARLKSEKWKQSHQSEEYKKKKRENSILLNQLGKINSPESRILISNAKQSVKNYNSKKISVYGIIWDDSSKCVRNGGAKGLTLRQLRYRAKSKNYPDIFYMGDN